MGSNVGSHRRHVGSGKDSFDRDELIRVWCLRHLEIIGEAAGRVSEDTRNQQKAVPWKSIIGMRNILIHGYFDIDWEQVWNAVANDLPPLKESLNLVLKNFPERSGE